MARHLRLARLVVDCACEDNHREGGLAILANVRQDGDNARDDRLRVCSDVTSGVEVDPQSLDMLQQQLFLPADKGVRVCVPHPRGRQSGGQKTRPPMNRSTPAPRLAHCCATPKGDPEGAGVDSATCALGGGQAALLPASEGAYGGLYDTHVVFS